jgi:hypothetical protein
MDLIRQTQPHIDGDAFLSLWLDLDEILEIEFFCSAIIRICSKGFEYFPYFQYEMVSDYILKYSKMNDDFLEELFNDFRNILENNSFIQKFNLYNEDEWNIENKKMSWILLKAKNLLAEIPYRYSNLLPL